MMCTSDGMVKLPSCCGSLHIPVYVHGNGDIHVEVKIITFTYLDCHPDYLCHCCLS